MPRNSMYLLADKVFGGGLLRHIRVLHDDMGLSYEDISKRLDQEGVSISGQTVRRWLEENPS